MRWGGAVYSNHWLTDAAAFVRSNRELLLPQPVWLFSSGPLGARATDSQGVDLCTAWEPKELCELREAIRPRGHRVFFGALVPGRLSVAELSSRELAYTRASLPAGDFRDWAQIQEWAERIALELAQCDATHEKDRLPMAHTAGAKVPRARTRQREALPGPPWPEAFPHCGVKGRRHHGWSKPSMGMDST